MSALLVSVPFQGGALLAAAGSYPEEGDRPVPLAPFCERLGIDTWTQTRKLNKVAWTCTSKMLVQIPGDDQAREMVTLPLRALAGWLFTINASRVKPEARPALVAYQREAADVLYRHFLAPAADVAALSASLGGVLAEVSALRGELETLKAKPVISLTLLSMGNGKIVDPGVPGLDPAGEAIARWALRLTAPWQGTGKDLLVALGNFPPGVGSSRGIEPALVKNKQALEAMGIGVDYLGVDQRGRNTWKIGGAA